MRELVTSGDAPDSSVDSFDEESQQEPSKEKREILEIARKRFSLGMEAEKKHREVGVEDQEFRAGRQWPSEIEQKRKEQKRPVITINKIPGNVHQITNDQRKNRTSVKVNPVDDKADVETAEVIQGLMRHIEHNSKADLAFDKASEDAVVPGRGFHRVVTEYCDPMSFDQDILIKRIANCWSVVVDPHYQEPDGSDINWGFIVEDVNVDDYKSQYPKSRLSKERDWAELGNEMPGWMSEKTCRIAEYFTKTWKQITIYQLPDGQVVDEEGLSEFAAATKEDLETLKGKLAELKKVRATTLPAIKWYKINGIEILEETDWPGRWIPIIPVHGDELNVNGERIFEGIVRHSKDSQRMYNYTASAEAEVIGLAPKAPWVGAEGQFEGHEHEWETAHQETYAYLEYKTTDHKGTLVPPPQRQFGEPPVQALTNARMLAADDIKSTTGIYDAAMGARSNETSGRGIKARAAQAQTSNFHYQDNLTISKRHTWNIVLDLIPHYYDSERAIRIIGPEGDHKTVWIHRFFEDKKAPNGQRKYDFSAGKYDVTLTEGPSDTTRRQEAFEHMLEFVRIYPQAGPIVGDLLAKFSDWPGSQEISERLKKLLPPEVTKDSEGEQQPIPPQVKAQLDQMGALVEKLTTALNEAKHKEEMKEAELESKERIEFGKMQNDIVKKQMEIDSKEVMAAFNHFSKQMAHLNQRLDLLGINQPVEIADPGQVNPMENEMTNDPQFGDPAEAEGLPSEYQPNVGDPMEFPSEEFAGQEQL